MRRFDAYESALLVLRRAKEQDLANEFIQGGIIDKFSLQFELGWKLLKDLLRYEGVASAATDSPREILKAAYRYFTFIDDQIWLRMLTDHNTMAHIYDSGAARRLVTTIIEEYIPAFDDLGRSIRDRYGSELENIA
jgi:nucleotidyltransferase substrate binding protein (TIGR01987 family)